MIRMIATPRNPRLHLYFWLNYCEKNHIERILVAVKNMDHLFLMVSEIIEGDNLHLFLLSDGTRIDDNEYLMIMRDDVKKQ